MVRLYSIIESRGIYVAIQKARHPGTTTVMLPSKEFLVASTSRPIRIGEDSAMLTTNRTELWLSNQPVAGVAVDGDDRIWY